MQGILLTEKPWSLTLARTYTTARDIRVFEMESYECARDLRKEGLSLEALGCFWKKFDGASFHLQGVLWRKEDLRERHVSS